MSEVKASAMAAFAGQRQEILQREVGRPTLWEVIHEGALRHVIGSREVMRAQLGKLIEAATSPDILLQVLPFSAHDYPGTDGPILIFDFEKDPSIAYAECDGGGMIIETPEQVTALTTKMRGGTVVPRVPEPPPYDQG